MLSDSQPQNQDQNQNATLESQPPAYESVSGAVPPHNALDYPKDVKHPLPSPQQQPQTTAMPALHVTPLVGPPVTTTSPTTGVTVYHYVHPVTQQRITSLLPPDHPEMVCLQKGHERSSTYGPVGILAAILWFPLGLACMFVDRKVRCTRCGAILQTGICD